MVTDAQYTNLGADRVIRATIGGIVMFVPDVMSNFHRRLIADWEALPNTIEPYEPPLDRPNPDLEAALRLVLVGHASEVAILALLDQTN